MSHDPQATCSQPGRYRHVCRDEVDRRIVLDGRATAKAHGATESAAHAAARRTQFNMFAAGLTAAAELGKELTYAEVGRTAGALPPGYHHVRRSVTIGVGSAAFEAAANTLLSWMVHSRAGMHVAASRPTAEPGALVMLSISAGPIRIGARAEWCTR